MPKTCNHEGCKWPRFGGGFCKSHQHLRTPRTVRSVSPAPANKRSLRTTERPGSRKTGKSIRRTTPKSAKKKREKAKLTQEDFLFYQGIWEEREHIDFETGEFIPGEALNLYFHHVLPKSKYPEYRHEKWNIVLVTWDTHSKAETNLDFVPKIKAYEAKLRATYGRN